MGRAGYRKDLRGWRVTLGVPMMMMIKFLDLVKGWKRSVGELVAGREGERDRADGMGQTGGRFTLG